jgi:hypothetical protein
VPVATRSNSRALSCSRPARCATPAARSGVDVAEGAPRAGLVGKIDRCHSGRCHEPLLDWMGDTVLVQPRPHALRLPRREELLEESLVDRSSEAVYPPETERLFNRVVVRERRDPGVSFRENEPDTGRGAVVLLQPSAPLAARGRLKPASVVNDRFFASSRDRCSPPRRRGRAPSGGDRVWQPCPHP